MKDAKVNMNRAPLSEKDIDKAKNFDQLMKMNAEPPVKIKWAKIGGIVAIIGGVLGYIFWPGNNREEQIDPQKSDKQQTETANSEFFKQTEVPYTHYVVNGGAGDTIVTPNGTRLIFPAGAFEDKEGNVISENVDIQFREFHDVPSIFGTNVDMTYDSAGTTYHFESAGMIEMHGFKNNKEVFVNADQPIIVELNSQYPGDHYNIYFMDPDGDWEFVSKDTSKYEPVVMIMDTMNEERPPVENYLVIKSKEDNYKKAKNELNQKINEAGLIVPQKANDELFSVKLSFKEKEFPELKGYKGILFEVTEKNKDFDKSLTKQEWTDIQLSKEGEDYLMTLFGKQKIKLIVRPVFAGEDMEEANQNFEELFAAYDAAHQGVLSEAREQMTTAYQSYKATEDSVINVINQSLNQAAWSDELSQKAYNVRRIFEVDNFGFWNSDCPQNLPKGQEVDPVFVNADDELDTLTFTNLYIAEYDKNAFFTYWGEWGHKNYINDKGEEKKQFISLPFTFNPKSETVLWAITNKGELAVITPEELGKVIFSKKAATTIKMKLHKKVIDVAKIKEAIGWK